MALLDIQAMELDAPHAEGNQGGSQVSIALCDSTASITLCL
jgi:hypothetical protein